jgi:hypothetical protein
MNSQMTYNGWANYETWCVNLWLTNEEPSYHYWREQAEECLREAERRLEPHLTPREGARSALADQLREEIASDESFPSAGLFGDLLSAALDSVDWAEVADSFLEEVVPAE